MYSIKKKLIYIGLLVFFMTIVIISKPNLAFCQSDQEKDLKQEKFKRSLKKLLQQQAFENRNAIEIISPKSEFIAPKGLITYQVVRYYQDPNLPLRVGLRVVDIGRQKMIYGVSELTPPPFLSRTFAEYNFESLKPGMYFVQLALLNEHGDFPANPDFIDEITVRVLSKRQMKLIQKESKKFSSPSIKHVKFLISNGFMTEAEKELEILIDKYRDSHEINSVRTLHKYLESVTHRKFEYVENCRCYKIN